MDGTTSRPQVKRGALGAATHIAMLMRWKTRALWAAFMLAFGAAVLWLRPEKDDPKALLVLLPVAAGYLVSRYWPRCPHCGTRVIRGRVDWLSPSSDCPVCHQEYDGPVRTPSELRLRGAQLLRDKGIISAADFRITEADITTEQQLRDEAQASHRGREELLRFLEGRLANHRKFLENLASHPDDPDYQAAGRHLDMLRANGDAMRREIDELRHAISTRGV